MSRVAVAGLLALSVLVGSLALGSIETVGQVEEVDCGPLPASPPARLRNPLHWHQSRVANLTVLPLRSLRPLVDSGQTAEYFRGDPSYETSPTPDLDDWSTFDNIEINGDRRNDRWNYVDEAGVVYQLISPVKSAFHQPGADQWDGDSDLGLHPIYSRPPIDAPESYPNRKFVTFPDHNDRSYEIVLVPDDPTGSGPPTFARQRILLNHPLQGTFNWADDAVSIWHLTLDVIPHRNDADMWPGGDIYQTVDEANALRVEGPEPGESLYANGIEQMKWLADMADNVDRLQKIVALGDDLVDVPDALVSRPIRVLRLSGPMGERFRLIDRNDKPVLDVAPEINHALSAYLDEVGLSCDDDSPGDDDGSGSGTGSGGVEINTPAPCRDPDYESPLTDKRFFPTCP